MKAAAVNLDRSELRGRRRVHALVGPDAYGSVATVPEPETYSLLLAELAVGAAVARRRRPS